MEYICVFESIRKNVVEGSNDDMNGVCCLQNRLVQLVDVFRPPSVYVKHVCYINFTT